MSVPEGVVEGFIGLVIVKTKLELVLHIHVCIVAC